VDASSAEMRGERQDCHTSLPQSINWEKSAVLQAQNRTVVLEMIDFPFLTDISLRSNKGECVVHANSSNLRLVHTHRQKSVYFARYRDPHV
jgi:hypothetical protein